MNYIDEDKAFEQWCENNYLPILSQAIWKKLFKRFNRSGWSEWVTVENQALMAEVQIRREATFIDLRNKLIDAGLIVYIKGKKGSPNKYKLISLCQKCTFTGEVQSEVYTVVQTEVQTVAQTEDITRQDDTRQVNKEKEKKEKTPPIPFSEILENETELLKNSVLEFVKHRNSLKKPFITEMQFNKWLVKLKKMGDEQAQVAIIEQSIIGGWQGLFPLKHESESSKIPQQQNSQTAKKSKFCNFKERENIDSAELQRLENERIAKELEES